MSGWPAVVAQTEAWTHLDTQVLAAPAASITFSGIAAAAAPRLRLYVYVVNDGTAGQLLIRLNSDAAGNYTNQDVGADSVTLTAGRSAAQTAFTTQAPGGDLLGASQQGLYVYDISKPVAGELGRSVCRYAFMSNDGTPVIEFVANAEEWANTAALINRVDLVKNAGNFAAGTRAVLEGVAT